MYNGLLCILLHYHNARCMSVRKTRNGGIIIIVEMRTPIYVMGVIIIVIMLLCIRRRASGDCRRAVPITRVKSTKI
jgi:hypothetical protein